MIGRMRLRRSGIHLLLTGHAHAFAPQTLAFMTSSEERVFVARMMMLAETTGFVEGFCGRRGIARDDGLRLILVVEELFTNTVRHGHGGDTESPVRIALSNDNDAVELFYEDTAPAYDPLSRLSDPMRLSSQSIESRQVGGLGVYLVGQLVHAARYAYEDGKNRLWITLRRTR